MKQALPYLLVGRINGRSSSRKTRRFEDVPAAEAAAEKWGRTGYNVFWIFGPAEEGNPSGLLREWGTRKEEAAAA